MRRTAILISLVLAASLATGCQSSGTSQATAKTAKTTAKAPPPPPPDPRTYTAAIFFDVGSADLSAEGARELREFAAKLRQHPKQQVQIQGYSELVAPEKDDRWLGEQRAKSVASYLVAAGIPMDNIRLRGAQAEGGTATPGNDRRVDVSVR